MFVPSSSINSRNLRISHPGLPTGKTSIFPENKIEEREAEEEEDGKEDTRVLLRKYLDT